MNTDARIGAAVRRLLELDAHAEQSPGGMVERHLRLYHGRCADGDGEGYGLGLGAEPTTVYGGDTLLEVLEGVVARQGGGQ